MIWWSSSFLLKRSGSASNALMGLSAQLGDARMQPVEDALVRGQHANVVGQVPEASQ
jgi:hypothetical protein